MNPLSGLLTTQFGNPGQQVQPQELSSSILKLQLSSTDENVAESIILLSHNPSWDGAVIGEAVMRAKLPELSWDNVMTLIERAIYVNNTGLLINLTDANALVNILHFFESAGNGLVLKFFSKKWANVELQVNLVSSCVYIDPEIFDFKSHGLAQVIDPVDFIGAPSQIQAVADALVLQPLNFVSLIHYSLTALSQENSAHTNATAFLDAHAKLVPELFFLGGISIPKPWPELLERVIYNFFELFLIGNASSSLVFYRLAIIDKELFINALIQSFSRDPMIINRIFAVAQEANILNDLLTLSQFSLALEISALADKQNLLSFGSFLKGNSKFKGPDFVRALLDFLELKATLEYSQNQSTNSLPGLNLRSVAAALQILNAVEIPPDRIEQYKAIQIQCLQSYPRLINYGQGYDFAILSHTDSNSFSSEVERKMKVYYQQMYEQQIEIRDIITMLQRLKQSSDPHEQDVFACMVHSLFDEYRFFPEYPLNALATTAVLFGSLVYFQLIDGMPLSIALRFILDSLRQPGNSNMFKFGLQALFEFRERLPEFPKYCHILLEIPGLAMHQQFFQQIKEIVGGLDGGQSAIIYSSINADIPVPDESIQEDPKENIKDKVLFIVNNIAINNLQGKTQELVSILDKKYYRWFASYIVGQRAKLEPNYHSLYISMLQVIGSKSLELHFNKVTYLQIVKLINSPDTANTPEKRNLLKNLGQWLGRLLLARNRPILHKNIAFKKLLCEGFDSQTLICVLPFVCKILEKSTDSTVFKPPNPWLMGILKVLAELYHFADLKLNLKFEIEVLCNTLKISLSDIEPSVIIRNHLAQDDIDSSQSVMLNNEMNRLTIQENQNTLEVNAPSQITSLPSQKVQQSSLLQQVQQNQSLSDAVSTTIPATTTSVQFNETPYIELVNHLVLVGSSVFVVHPVLKRPFIMAIEKALQEVLQPVVERSVTIASFSTSSLVLKDFALEPDEHKVRLAARNVVESLAANIALVTAKDLLRDSLATNLRLILMNHGYTETTMPTDQIAIAINNNIDIICSIVERAAVDRSVAQIEEVLQPAFMNRKRYFESGTSQPFADQVSTYALQLPEPFRLKVGGLDSQQFAIYEDFGKTSAPYEGGQPDIQSMPNNSQQLQSQIIGLQDQANLPQQPLIDGQAAENGFDISDPRAAQLLEHALSQIQNAIESLSKICEESTEKSFKELDSEHRVSVLISQILRAVDLHAFREQLIARTSQITVTLLFACDKQLVREALCFLLEQLCSLSSSTNKEVTFWLLFSEDQRKLNAPVTLSILKSGLVSCADLDVSLAKQVQGKIESVIAFAVEVITTAVLGPEPCALRADFAATLEALEEVEKDDSQYASVSQLMNSLSKSSQLSRPDKTESVSSSKASQPTLDEQMRFIFAEWVRLSQHPARNNRQFKSFIYQLSKHDILTTPEYAIAFVRLSFEFALNCYTRDSPPGTHPNTDEPLIALDALAKLFSAIIQSSAGGEMKARLAYTQRLLSVISFVLIDHHEKNGENFDEQPYFRFFSSLFYELNLVEAEEPDFSAELYILIADIFKTLQPFAVPGFAFAWMSLISHRYYLPKLLELPEKRGWSHIVDFLCELLDFEGTYAQGKNFPKAITVMYQGTLRIFFAILSDCPQIFIENHYVLCKHIPSSFVQIRNLVLSAFPEKMELPDPLTQGLKVDRLPEIKEIPIYAVDPAEDMQRLGLKKLVDSYVKSPSQALLKGIAGGFKLTNPKAESGLGFDSVSQDAAAFNSFAFYVGIKATSDKEVTGGNTGSTGSEEESSTQFNRDSPYLALLCNLLLELNIEGRYFLCEAMANQLRYPNRHTHFFSCVILSLFGNYGSSILGSKKIDIRHLITRVLLERIICNRPHPWGLMIPFTELLKNSNYKFWDLPFTKSTPEIERMFESLYEHISNGNSIKTTTSTTTPNASITNPIISTTSNNTTDKPITASKSSTGK